KTFFFGSYEYTQREETGFSSIGVGNFGLVPFQGLLMTADQAAEVTKLAGQGQFAQAQNYAALVGSASSVALFGVDPGLICGSVGLCAGPGARFPLPVDCPAGATIGTVQCTPFGVGTASLPQSYATLNSLRGNYPVKEKTSLWSLRLDQNWNSN